jgi:molecular chaperone GrpE
MMHEEGKKKRKSTKAKLEKELETVKTDLKDYHERYMRALADLENFKKRTAKERQEYTEYATTNLVRAFLGVLDNFERAIESGKIASEFEPFYQGVKMIYDELKRILEGEGLKQFTALGEEFNPEMHEAVVALESDDPPNVIVDELQKGYIFKDRIIRPAKVAVSKNRKKEVEEDAESNRN